MPLPGTATIHFGFGLALSSGRLAVSAPSVAASSVPHGEVHLYKQDPLNRLFRPELVLSGAAPMPVPGVSIGRSIALEGGLLATSRGMGQFTNGIDETYVLVPGTTDCDLDGQPDACQILLGQRRDDNRNGFVDECELSGVRYCAPAVPNSAGTAARMNVFGPAHVLLFYLELFVSGLPPGAPGYVLMAQSSEIVANPGAWLGNLCVAGGQIARGVGGVLVADRDGGFWFWHNRPVVPLGTGLAPILPGQTWNFQCWYLDAAMIPRSNFSDANAVTFTLL